MRRRRAIGIVCALVLVASCGSGGGSHLSSRLRAAVPAISKTADPVAASDAQTEALLDEAGVRRALGASADAIYALLEKDRHRAIGSEPAPDFAKVRTAAFVVPSPESEAQLLASSSGVMFAVEFAEYFRTLLDPATAGQIGSGTINVPKSPPIVDDDGTRTASTTISETWTVSASGSKVTMTLTGTVEQKVVDDKTHATLADVTDTRTYRGDINVCPDTAGQVPATVTNRIRIRGAASSTVDATLTLLGHVDDNANLASVDASYQNLSSWATGGVSLELDHMSLTGSSKAGYNPANLDVGHATGNVDTKGDATDASVKLVASDAGLTLGLIEPVFTEAQRLWRHGRCVVVAVPRYNAETPLPISQQNEVQHTEEVDKSSETSFPVTLKHRFGAAPVAPVVAQLSGEDKIDPDRIDKAPGSMTYKAPAEDDKTATLTLTSTSKRGIGKLVIRFSVKPKRLAMSMTGSVTFGAAGIALSAQVRATQAEFKPVGDGTYRASLPASTTYSVTIPSPECPRASGSEGSGTLVFDATPSEGPNKRPVWKVTFDGNRSKVNTNESACGRFFSNVALSGTAGGLVGAVASVAGPLTFPADGGTVHVHKAFVDATFVATVPKS